MINLSLNKFYESYIDAKQITTEIQLEAWQSILNSNVKLEENFCNPHRNDNTPGCKLYNVNGIILLSDYGDDFWNRSSIFKAVQHIYGVNYARCLQIIYYDLATENSRKRATLHTSASFTPKPQFKFQISIVNRNWRKFDRQFYGYGDITREQLEFETCFPISKYWTNSKRSPKEFLGFQCNKKDPGYSYVLDDNIKMRFPKRDKSNKWISNITKNQIGGKTEITNYPGELRTIIITKSLRDYLVIYNCGYNCRFVSNESVYLSKSFIKWLDENFDIIIFIMDNDARGIATSKRIISQCKNVIPHKFVYSTYLPIHYLEDRITDPFDLVKHPKYSIRTLEDELSYIYEQAEEKLDNFENEIL